MLAIVTVVVCEVQTEKSTTSFIIHQGIREEWEERVRFVFNNWKQSNKRLSLCAKCFNNSELLIRGQPVTKKCLNVSQREKSHILSLFTGSEIYYNWLTSTTLENHQFC